MESFLLSWNAVAPLFFIVVIGCIINASGMLSNATCTEFNKICFNIFLSCNLFYNVYTSELSQIINSEVVVFCIAGILMECVVGIIVIPRLTTQNTSRGAMLQGMFRTNLALVGLPIIDGIYNGNLGPFPLLVAVIIPIYNLLGSIVLEYYRGNGKVNLLKIFKGIIKNPLVIGTVLGIVFALSGLKLPQAVENTVSYFSKAATGVALLILGASLQLGKIKGNCRLLSAFLALRLVAFPVAASAVAIGLGFRGVQLASILMVFGCPLGTVTYTIAQQMESDAELAGEQVVFSTIFSCFTLFLYIFVLNLCGFL